MHSPLSNCFQRPRSSTSAPSGASRRQSFAATSAVASPQPSTSTLVSPQPRLSVSEYASLDSWTAFSSPRLAPFSPLLPDDDHHHHRNSSSLPDSHQITSPAGPFYLPSPLSLNVPLERGSSYQPIAIADLPSSSLSLSADRLLYAGLSSGDVAISTHLSLDETARFGVGTGVVRALLVHEDTVFTAHADHKIRLWRRRKWKYKLAGTLPSTKDYVMNVLTDRNYVQVRRHRRSLWIQHVDAITALAIGPDGRLLYSGSWDRTVKVWRLASMRCVQSIKAHDDAVNDVAVSGSDLLFTASADTTVKVWRRVGQQRVLLAELRAHTASVNALALRADGSLLYSGGSDACVHVWERRELLEDGAPGLTCGMRSVLCLRGHRQAVLCLAAAGPLVCSGSADRTIRVWRKAAASSAHTCVAVLQGHTCPVKCVCLSVSTFRSCFVYSGALDATTRVWSVVFERESNNTPDYTPPPSSTSSRLLTPPPSSKVQPKSAPHP